MNKYKLIALCGEAGSGKDTLAQALCERYNWNFIISCTTRPMREGEQEGVNYYYLTPEKFAEKVVNGDMLETTFFNDWAYGASIDAFKQNVINVGVFNPEGIEILKSDNRIDLSIYYLSVNKKERLLRQLLREKNPNVDEIVRRYITDTKDFDLFLNDEELSKECIILKNETKEDLEENIKYIKFVLDN